MLGATGSERNRVNIEAHIREYLPGVWHMSLATSSAGLPWVCEVHFAYDDELNLYFRSLLTRRHSQEIALNPRVAGNIVKQFGLSEAPSGVYFEGSAKLLSPGKEEAIAAQCIAKRLKTGDTILADAHQEGGHRFYKIAVETYYLFGKFDTDRAQKFELPWGNKPSAI